MDEMKKIRIINILSMSFSSLISDIGKIAGQRYKTRYTSAIHKRNKSHPFIPYTPKVAVEQLLTAFDFLVNEKNIYNKKHFLDAGCGIGNIMLLAKKVGFISHGLEIDPALIRMAKKINSDVSCNIIKQNIMTYKNYDEYDVIYYFCPFACHKKQAKFEERVEDQMKIGALLIANYKQSNRIDKDKRFYGIFNTEYTKFMYIKKSK